MSIYNEYLSAPYTDAAAPHTRLADRLWLTIFVSGPSDEMADFAAALTYADAIPVAGSPVDQLRAARTARPVLPPCPGQFVFRVPLGMYDRLEERAGALGEELISRWGRSTFVIFGAPTLAHPVAEALVVRNERATILAASASDKADVLVVVAANGVLDGVLSDGKYQQIAFCADWADVIDMVDEFAVIVALDSTSPNAAAFDCMRMSLDQVGDGVWTVRS